MKKFFFHFAVIGSVVFSCSNDSNKYEKAAMELCHCMNQVDLDPDDSFAVNLNLGLCLMDSKINLKAPELAKEVKKQCPEFLEGFAEFVKELK